jgi:hypothetical protein
MQIDKPTFYSRIFIAVYSLFMTPIGGAILLCINLKTAGKQRFIPLVMAAAVAFEMVHFLLIMHYQPVGSGLFFGPLFLGAMVLAFPVWRLLLDGLMFYDAKPVWGPILVMVGIWGAVLAAVYAHIF